MKIENRQPDKTADVSSARDSAGTELRSLLLIAVVVAAVLYVGLGALVEFGVQQISFEQEQQLFAVFSDVHIALETDETTVDQRARVQTILDKLVAHPDVPDANWRLVILEGAEPNAFAFPGGTIGVTSGLLEAIPDNNALAFVLGHELGHSYHRDHLRGLGRTIAFGIGYALIFGAESGSDYVLPVLLNVLERQHSRGQESTADEFGLRILFDQYGTTEGFDALFSLLASEREGPRWTAMLTTHPAPQNRIETLREYALELEGASKEW